MPRSRVAHCAVGLVIAVATLGNRTGQAQAVRVGDFFRSFSTEWVLHDPDQATRTRFLNETEQGRLERQMTPLTLAWRQDRIALAKAGLARLGAFDRASFSPTEQVSADVMQWQLQTLVDEAPYLDYAFPLEQFRGANVSLPEALISSHPLRTEADGENYVARLGQMSARMGEAVGESQRLATKGILPPRFILEATIAQMEGFIQLAPGQNPLVTTLEEKLATTATPLAQRTALKNEAERVVSGQVYPAWRHALGVLKLQVSKATTDAGLWRLESTLAAGDSVGRDEIWQFDVMTNEKRLVFTNAASVSDARLSPDGRWLAYVSDESGRREVYLRPFPGAGAPVSISSAGGYAPRWRSDGGELFFIAPQGSVMSVATNMLPRMGKVNTVLHTEAVAAEAVFSVSPDGQRFLLRTSAPLANSALTVIHNWTARVNGKD